MVILALWKGKVHHLKEGSIRMKKRLSLSLIVLLTFVLAMTGCGSKNPAQTETGGTTTGGTTAGAEKPGSKLNIDGDRRWRRKRQLV